jgi:hypothetical protein
MRVVIGAHALVHPAGTETYVGLIARELQRLGHDVTVHAEELGPLAEHLEREQGAVLARTAGELPGGCDAVLANDAMSAAALGARYPDARLVQVAHSDLFDHQLPLLVPGAVDAVVVCSERIAKRMRALALDVPIVRLRLPVDTDRFAGMGPLPATPRRALIVSNYLDGARRRALVEAWGAHGVTCEQVGAPGRVELDPGPVMRDADIVVAKARAALEAMACHRAVYVFDEFGGDGWITPETYAAFEADNLAGHATPAPRTPAQLAADLADYHPDMGWINGELVRLHHGSRHHARALVEVLSGPRGAAVEAPVLAEVGRLTRMAWTSERRRIAAQQEAGALRARVVAAEAEAAAAAQDAAELPAWRARAARAEEERDAARGELAACAEEKRAWEQRALRAERLLATARVRAGILAGRALDRLRGRPRR